MTATETYRAYKGWATEAISEPPRVSVVIPAYNEEWRILPTVGAIATHMCSRQEPWELIVADDGSTDGTVALLEELRLPNLRVLRADRNGGKGRAVRRGVAAARGAYVLFADADQSTPIQQFDTLLHKVTTEGYDIAVGSRAAAGATVSGKSLARRVLTRGLRLMVRVGFGIRIQDTQCGFKLFTATGAERLFGMQLADDFSFDLEVLYLSAKLGMRTAEVPVEWIDAPGSTVASAKVTMQFVRALARIRINSLLGRYQRTPAGARIPGRGRGRPEPPPSAPGER
jgi:dolichyl-phosphate beta-glucosyltransferase